MAGQFLFQSIPIYAVPSSPVIANICTYSSENGSYVLRSTFFQVVSVLKFKANNTIQIISNETVSRDGGAKSTQRY